MSHQTACNNMIKQQLRTGDVLDSTILSLFTSIPRDSFVPKEYTQFAYSDLQIPLAHGQRMMSPLEEATLIQSLKLQGHETVLEVGTGSGFLTALLSRLAKKVISIDYYKEFTTQAQKNLSAHHCSNVELITADAVDGWLELAPYDVIIFTGTLPALTETQRLQVLPGGKLFAIIGQEPIMKGILFNLSHDNQWSEELLFETNIPSLVNRFITKPFVL